MVPHVYRLVVLVQNQQNKTTLHFKNNTKTNTTISYLHHRYRLQIQEPVPSLSRHRAPIGGIWVPPDQNNYHSSGAYVLQSEREYARKHVCKHAWERRTGREDCRRILFAFVSVCWLQKPEYPQLELHGWRRHYTKRYSSSGISFLYLWFTLKGTKCKQ